MSQQRKITDEREAQRCLAAARKAGKRVGDWARAHGIDGRSLNAWRMNLARRRTDDDKLPPRPPATASRRARVALVELVPRERPREHATRYTVQVGVVRIEVGDDFDPVVLRRLVEALRTC